MSLPDHQWVKDQCIRCKVTRIFNSDCICFYFTEAGFTYGTAYPPCIIDFADLYESLELPREDGEKIDLDFKLELTPKL